MQTTREGMALAEYMRRYEDVGPFEIVDGAIVPVSRSVFGSGDVAGRLHEQIILFLASHRLGTVYAEMPFVLPDTPTTN